MAVRDITVRVKAEIGAFQRDMAAAAEAAKKTGKETAEAGAKAESGIGKLSQIANTHEKAWDQVATGMLAAGTAITAGAVLATKAAIDWESAWTGVTKTVDGTPAQLAEIEDGLRGLAKTLPSTHTEIAGVAEAAGQLGVARDDVVGFTKTMIDLGESTNLTADEAATNIAQISNVMGTMEREGTAGVERFGSALVALGNDGASTEAEILSMAQRIAGAGATVGASETDILALSNTLASMGVNAELGGGVVTRVLLKMRSAVDEGGDSLESFAKTAGLSADEFAEKFKSSPVEAMDLVSKGINGVNQAGGNVTATLAEMGIKGTQESQVMLALANSGDLLTDSLTLGAQAWSENSALTDEATKRYETAESRIKIAWNTIKDAAITAGGAILPVVATLADGVATVVGAFTELPEPVQSSLGVLAGVTGVALLGAGALMKLVPTVLQTVSGLKALGGALSLGKAKTTFIGPLTQAETALNKTNTATGKLTRGAQKLGRAAFGIGTAATALMLFGTATTKLDPTTVEDMADAIIQLNGIGDSSKLNDLFAQWDSSVFDTTEGMKGLSDAVYEVLNPAWDQGINSWADKAFAWTGLAQSNFTQATDKLTEFGDELGNVVSSGDPEEAAAAFTEVAASFEANGKGAAEALAAMPGYSASLERIAEKAGVTLTGQEKLEWALSGIAPASLTAAGGTDTLATSVEGLGAEAEDTAESFDDIIESLMVLGELNRSAEAAADGLTTSIAALGDSIDTNGKKLKGNSEAAIANRSAMRDVADATWASAEAYARQGENADVVEAALRKGYDSLLKNADAMDMNAQEAEAYARATLGIPDEVNVDTWMSDSARLMAETTAAELEALPNHTSVTVAVSEDGTVGQVQEKINGVTGKTEYVFVTDDGSVVSVQSAIANIDGTDVPVWVDDNGTVYGTQADINSIQGKGVTVTANAATNSAENELNHTARPRTSTIIQKIKQSWSSNADRGPITSQFGRYMGGKLPSKASGGKLGYTGLGRDQILGVSSLGKPIVNVDDGEWIVRERNANKYNATLTAINNDDPSVRHLADAAPAPMASMTSATPAYASSYGQGGGGSGVTISGPLVSVGQMIVRNDSDIQRISQDLQQRISAAGRANGQSVMEGLIL